MSQENVEIVRRYAGLLSRFMAALRAHSGPVNETPFIDEFFQCLDPEIEWHWPLTDEAFRGREGMVRAVTDFLDAVDDWRIEIDELVDAGGDQVFCVQRVSARGKESGTPFEQSIFTALKVRDGKIWQIHDFTERADALKAVGLAE
jgi:ketosteroid isomerase-like protein